MGYKPKSVEKVQHALFGGKVTEAASYNVYQLANPDMSYSCKFQVLGEDTICHDIPSVPVGPWISQLKSNAITLSDVNNTSDVGILIGADVFARLYFSTL